MDRNSLCSQCRNSASVSACACSFPLPQFCCNSACLSAHTATPNPAHHTLPLESLRFITKTNYARISERLTHIQAAYCQIGNLGKELEAFEGETIAAFCEIEQLLADIREEFITNIAKLRLNVQELGQVAFIEATNKATNASVCLTNPVSEAIWQMANTPSAEKAASYRLQIQIPTKEELSDLLRLAVLSSDVRFPSLSSEKPVKRSALLSARSLPAPVSAVETVTLTCAHCKQPFPLRDGHSNLNYCSLSCELQRESAPRCKSCGKEIKNRAWVGMLLAVYQPFEHLARECCSPPCLKALIPHCCKCNGLTGDPVQTDDGKIYCRKCRKQ